MSFSKCNFENGEINEDVNMNEKELKKTIMYVEFKINQNQNNGVEVCYSPNFYTHIQCAINENVEINDGDNYECVGLKIKSNTIVRLVKNQVNMDR